MRKDKICAFLGQATVTDKVRLYIIAVAEILNAVEQGCSTFYFGGFGEFDELCYKIVTKIQKEHSEWGIRRIFVPQERYFRKKTSAFKDGEYEAVMELASSFDGWEKSRYFRSCAMIDQSDYVIFCAEESDESEVYKAYKYAQQKKEKQIVNLWRVQAIE